MSHFGPLWRFTVTHPGEEAPNWIELRAPTVAIAMDRFGTYYPGVTITDVTRMPTPNGQED